MKKIIIAATCLLSIGFLFNSCSVEKRHYLNGYHVEWNKNNKKVATVIDKAELVQVNTPVQPAMSEVVATPTEKTDITITPVTLKENVSINFSVPAITKSSVKENEKPSVTTDVKVLKQGVKAANKDNTNKTLLIVLCFLLPWLAVGLATDWDVKKVVFNLLWSLTCIGGIIHALIIVSKS